MFNKNFTQVQISKKTRGKLKKLRVISRETYDEIINRLIEKYTEKILNGKKFPSVEIQKNSGGK